MQVTSSIACAILSGCTMIYICRRYLGNATKSIPFCKPDELSWDGDVNRVDLSAPWFACRELKKKYGHSVFIRLLPESVLAFICLPITYLRTWPIRFLLDILATGPTPKHIAFEMDGNRRYARGFGMQGKDGHPVGFKNLIWVLGLCSRLRIQCVTVYAFSIDNFNRPKEEVDMIMGLLKDKLVEMAQPGAMFDRHGIRLNVLGRRELFPPNVQAAVQEAEDLTRHNNTVILNICAPYSSQDEITTSVEDVIRSAINSGDLDGSTITEESINSHLSTSLAGSPPLDIFIRTSGVKRLSGFLLWQCSEHTQMHMVNTYWPELGVFDLVPVLLEYQRKVWAKERRGCVLN